MAYQSRYEARLKHERPPASAGFSRLLVIAYLTAVLLAVGCGGAWLAWHLVLRWLSQN